LESQQQLEWYELIGVVIDHRICNVKFLLSLYVSNLRSTTTQEVLANRVLHFVSLHAWRMKPLLLNNI
jgi:hypothetical protein